MSDRVLQALVTWGERTDDVRAMILTSTRATADGPVDEFSDYDVILVVTEPATFARGDLAWQSVYGTPLVRWGDESELYGLPTSFRGVVYDDHVKVDYSIWPDALIDAVAERDTLPPGLDHGYRVLLDKDGRTRLWPAPTYTAYILARPSEAEYRALVEEFWWGMTYAAKALRRGELFFAHSFMLEHDLKLIALLRMLEWRRRGRPVLGVRPRRVRPRPGAAPRPGDPRRPGRHLSRAHYGRDLDRSLQADRAFSPARGRRRGATGLCLSAGARRADDRLPR